MPEPDERSGIGASPVKLASAAVLAVVFVVVLVVQLGGASDTEGTVKQQEAKERRVRAPRQTGAPQAVSQSPRRHPRRRDTPRWPVLPAADMLAHDPFAVPATFFDQESSAVKRPQRDAANGPAGQLAAMMQKQAELEQALAGLEQEGVKAVISDGRNGHVAVLGSQTVHVGDLLDGFRVVAIERDGVVLEPMPAEPPAPGPSAESAEGDGAPATPQQHLWIKDQE